MLGKVFQKFAEKGQDRFLHFWSSMSIEEKKALKKEFENISLEEMTAIYEKCKSQADNNFIDASTLKPLPDSVVVKLYNSDPNSIDNWRKIGYSSIEDNKMGIVLMAGIFSFFSFFVCDYR